MSRVCLCLWHNHVRTNMHPVITWVDSKDRRESRILHRYPDLRPFSLHSSSQSHNITGDLLENFSSYWRFRRKKDFRSYRYSTELKVFSRAWCFSGTLNFYVRFYHFVLLLSSNLGIDILVVWSDLYKSFFERQLLSLLNKTNLETKNYSTDNIPRFRLALYSQF